MDPLPFQRRFIRAIENPAYQTCALSISRGNGKTTLSGYLLARAMTPGDRLFQQGNEVVLVSASLRQARQAFRVMRSILEPKGGYVFQDTAQRIGARHTATNTRLEVYSSKAKAAFGLVGVSLAILDEPGALENIGGAMLWDALTTAQGKPESPLKICAVGTLAPAEGGWWHDLIDDGTVGSVYVQAIVGRRDKWDSVAEIRRSNPLKWKYPESRKALLEARDAARKDSRKKATFLSYLMNCPSRDESEMLLTVQDWQTMIQREPAERVGAPIVAVDAGNGRAWSSAVAVWRSGRLECCALAPGLPSLEEQEKRDRVSPGTYTALADAGLLEVAEGLRVQPMSKLWGMIKARWGIPVNVLADRARFNDLLDSVKGETGCESRVTRWFEASADVRALRSGAMDGPLTVAEESRPLLAASLAVAMVKSDDQGNTRLVKRDAFNNTSRDDVAAGLTLVAGAFDRANKAVAPTESIPYAVV